MSSPLLIEPGVKYFLKETLKNCNKTKQNYYYFWANIGFLCLFLTVLALLLVWKKKTKLSKEEITEKRALQQKYILDKIRNIREQKMKANNTIITNLPKFESDFELLHKNYYKI
jgi:hypothetical protein